MTLKKTLKTNIIEYLKEQGITEKSAITNNDLPEELANVFIEECLTFIPDQDKAMTIDDAKKANDLSAIVGFAFGNHFKQYGNRCAGTINQKLWALVLEYYQETKLNNLDKPSIKVYTQWEIGCYNDVNQPRHILPGDLIIIEPKPNIEKDTVDYISTFNVMEEVSKRLPEKSKILVIAHPHHILRCTKIVESFGYQAIAIKHTNSDFGYWYDNTSGQLWTRTPHLYLIHDLLGRLSLYRSQITQEAKKQWLGGIHLCNIPGIKH